MLGMGGEIGQCVYVCVLCGYMFPIKKLLDLPQWTSAFIAWLLNTLVTNNTEFSFLVLTAIHSYIDEGICLTDFSVVEEEGMLPED